MKKVALIIPFIFAIIFPILFHRQQAGLNVLFFNVLILGLLLWNKRLLNRKPVNLLITAGSLLSALMVVVHGSDTALTINIFSLILISGLAAAPYLSVLSNSFIAAFIGAFVSPFEYLKESGATLNSNQKAAKGLRRVSFLIVPLIILFIFISIYSASSPYYNHFTGNLLSFVNDTFLKIFRNISPAVFWIGIGGLVVGVIMFFGKVPSMFELPFEKGANELVRERRYFRGSPQGLKYEMSTAVFTFILLNIALVVMNFLDLWHVWLKFKWDGGFLKQFVHEGTWLLILSIIISIFLVLWYFRGNLNFYSKNRLLINLTRIWLCQNVFLAFSVAVRNYWYLHYFNLAFKRIWVFAFLIIVVFGLVTVLIKVNRRKSLRYLFFTNSMAVYIVFLALCVFNWDNVIARFNINRSEVAFFHTDFMETLDSSTLPILIMSEEQIKQVKKAQSNIFSYHGNYESLEDYNNTLKIRRKDFVSGYPKLHWLSWTLSDYNTYQKLK